MGAPRVGRCAGRRLLLAEDLLDLGVQVRELLLQLVVLGLDGGAHLGRPPALLGDPGDAAHKAQNQVFDAHGVALPSSRTAATAAARLLLQALTSGMVARTPA